MHPRAAAVNALWCGASAHSWWRFRRALRNPASVQQQLLMGYLTANQATAIGRMYRFESIRSIAEYQSRVPISTFDDLEPFIDRVASGEDNVVTTAPVERFVPSGGSTAAAKLVPFTPILRREFTRAVDAWLFDLMTARPSLGGGPAYWAISPPACFGGSETARVSPGDSFRSAPEPRIPIGFEDDSMYLGGTRQILARAIMAVPPEIGLLQDPEVFRYATVLFLLHATELRLISVWHPSFLERLLDTFVEHRERLIRDVERGPQTNTEEHGPQKNTEEHRPQITRPQTNTEEHRPQITRPQTNTEEHRPQTTRPQTNTEKHRPQTTRPQTNTEKHRPQTTRPQTNTEEHRWEWTLGDLVPPLRANPRRAAALRAIPPDDVRAIWPALEMVSCWADGPARGPAEQLARRLGGISIQPKGLLATEGVVTIPFQGLHPLAVRSHFFEFVEQGGQVCLAHELREGAEYVVLLTTGGGLYRYRLGDRVRVDGFIGCTPSLRFIGKEDRVSDWFGEKLSEGFVAGVLESILGTSAAPRFAMLAPEKGRLGMGYALFVETDLIPPDLAARLEEALRRNPHYAWCVDMRQLEPARVVQVAAGAMRRYVDACAARGQRIGDVKPAALRSETGWGEILDSTASCGRAIV
jgi:hypothetical protein